jgi:hypothetical protein
MRTRSHFNRSRVGGFVVVALLVVGALIIAGLGSFESDRPNEVAPGVEGLGSALCAAYGAAGSDPAQAAEIFERDIHGPLHELAARVMNTDRMVAARLLEAKYASESAVGQYSASGELAPVLGELARQAHSAFTAVGPPSPRCLAEVAEL